MQTLIDKYHIVFDGKKRRYIYPLPQKLFDLEYTSPDYLRIGGEVLTSSSWGELICKLSIYLYDNYPFFKGNLLDFKTSWSKASIFVYEKRINHVEIKEGVFANLNHTALHSCWLIIDLLEFCKININACELLIHRMPKAEPKEVRDYIRNEFKKDFRKYISRHCLLTEDKVEKAIKNIDYLNNIFSKRRSGYDDLYLFDDALMFATMKSKFLPEFAKSTNDYEKYYKIAKKYLDYLSDFYRDNGYYSKNS